jgi:hypothetical protein
MLKEKIARYFVEFTNSWNEILHREIERKVIEGYNKSFIKPHENFEEMEKIIKEMSSFYYQRMMNTASLLFAAGSIFISVIALLIAIAALFH